MSEESLMEALKKRLVGFARLCGVELISTAPGEITGACRLREELLNPYGMVHGGAVNTLLDTLGGMAACSARLPMRYVVTRSADIHFLRPISGERMTGKAHVIHSGRQMCLVQAEAFDDQGRLCASGQLEFFYVDKA